MARPVAQLARLNEVDLQVDAATSRLAAIAEALKESASLQAARASLAAAEKELARYRTMHQVREGDRQKAAARLADTEQRLYGGKVRNPKDLENLAADRDQLRRQNTQAEDALLEAMIGLETANAQLAAAQEQVSRLEAQFQANSRRLRAEQARLQEQLASLQALQRKVRQSVPAELLPLYDGLRRRKAGHAVAPLEGDTCGICHVAAPPSKLEAARYGDELCYCDSCGRLLFGE